jgi:hypothetical protein
MSTPYDAVPEASDAAKVFPNPSIEAGPAGRLIFVDAVPFA